MEQATTQPFVPVILGGNRGAYGLARAFYEEYGIPSVVISPFLTGPINHSQIVQHYQLEKMSDLSSFQTTMKQIDAAHPLQQKILFGSDDRYVEELIAWREHFSPDWIVPYVDAATYQAVTDKTQFYALCERVGVPYPRTLVLQPEEVHYRLTYPIIIKPAQTPAYQKLSFNGKKKVYICVNEAEAVESIQLIRANGYRGELILQEYIPGDDSTQGIVMAYVAKKDRQLKLLSFANVLVDDPTPDAIGNSLACIVQENDELTESIQKLFAATDFYGFATFDVKYDANRGRYVFFELNGRLGSSNYYVTAAGVNVAKYYIEDFFYQRELPQAAPQKEVLYSMLPKALLLAKLAKNPLKSTVNKLYQAGKVVHPLDATHEKNWKRKGYVLASSLNYCLKLLKFPSLEKSSHIPEKDKIVHTKQAQPLPYYHKNHNH